MVFARQHQLQTIKVAFQPSYLNCITIFFPRLDRTPMHLAAENGHASIIELLADKFRASIFERTKDGSTLMHIASLNGHADCAHMLFKKGVFLHMPNKGGARSIHTAARKGHVGIINTLLQKGEHVDVTTNVRLIKMWLFLKFVTIFFSFPNKRIIIQRCI